MYKLILFLFLCLSTNTIFSQTIQLTNGGSTTLSGATGAAPISAFFEYNRVQVVYTAAELNAAGITGSKTVTQLGWYVTTAPANTLPDYKIRLGHTTATNSGAHDASALTEVYNNASYAPVAGGFNMLTLNGSFVWNGTDNLLVDVCYGPVVYASPYGEVRTYAATTTNGSRRVRCDACGSQCTNNTSTTSTFKPQVSLTFAAPPSCLSPTVTVVPGNTSAALSWAAVTGATGYEWAVTTSATPPASGTATTLTSANASGLTAITQYYAHVRTQCGGPFSVWATVPFKTSFDCTTAEIISACAVSKSVSLSGTGVYNVTACGFSTPGTEKLYTFTPTITGNYTLNITAANGEWIDYFYKAASGGCGETGWTCIDDISAVGTVVFGPLTAGITYYILLDPEDATVTSTATFQLDCPASLPPPCTTNLTPTNGAINVAPPPVLTWNAAAGATGYNIFFGTANPPTTNIGTTASTTATINGTIGGTTYYWYVQPTNSAGGAAGCDVNTFSFTTATAPINDTACGAIDLTLGGAQDCKNTANATAVGDPALPGSCSTPNNTVWYKYTPASTGTVIVRTEIPAATTNALNGWIAWYTATGTCPSPPGLSFNPVAGSVCQEFGQTGAGDIDSLISPVLTGGTTYYLMIDGFGGDNGEFCISLAAPPAPPVCTTNLLPLNGATGVLIPGGQVNISWNAAATATSYDVFFGTVNPPTTNIGNTTATNVNITGLAYNTTYYWYVAPRNTGGPATGCNTSTTSFTTENPTNCIPLYTTGCTLADSLTYFSLKGNAGTVIYNPSGATCNATPRAYSDYTAAFTAVTLSRTESYSGKMRTGDPNDYATIWIDGNDNGFFEDSERLLDNLKIGTTEKLYSIYIPATTPTGIHRLRVRVIYSGIKPTTLTHPCNSYPYGETEDYLVNITGTGSVRSVAPGTPGSCVNAGETTIGASSNNNVSAPVYLVDSLNNYVCGIYPDGNNLGLVQANYYVHNGPVRQDVTGRYYMDRNVSIGTEIGPASPYRYRYYFLNAELNALIAQPGSGVTSIFDLVMTKTNGPECVTQYVQQVPTFQSPTGFGSLSGDRFLDFIGFTSFSRFFLHGGSTVLLPVNFSTINAAITGATNTVYWTTATETNNHKFVVQKSMDATNYTSIGEQPSAASNGNSSTVLNYSFSDNNPLQGKTYYRLQIVDKNGRTTYSPIVSLRRGEGKLEIVDVRPNPTSGIVYFNVLGTNGNVHVAVRDLNGKEVLRKGLVQSNSFRIDLSKLVSGMYILEAVDVRSGEKAIFKVVKD
jgi:hypothetical protein